MAKGGGVGGEGAWRRSFLHTYIHLGGSKSVHRRKWAQTPFVTRTCTYFHQPIHTQSRNQTQTHSHIHTRRHIHGRTHTLNHTPKRMHIRTHIRIYSHARTQRHSHTRAYTCSYPRTDAHPRTRPQTRDHPSFRSAAIEFISQLPSSTVAIFADARTGIA